MKSNPALRRIPSVDRLVNDPRVRAAAAGATDAATVELVREAVAGLRQRLSEDGGSASPESILEEVASYVASSLCSSLAPVINATGVIIHTNLGRASLSRAAVVAAEAAARGYTNLEFDLATGERGSRFTHLDPLLRRATGAEAGMAVNNNAAALYLVLHALCAGREVVISRGQLVEIGGGFRIPDVMAASGAHLVEVGTTNRTYLRDYEAAVTPDTSALLRVHASNFKVIGFTESATADEIAGLAHERGLLAIDDLGSGALLDTSAFGLAPEPTAQASLRAGMDLVLFSGDKLLGGPQAGIIVGRRELIERLRRYPLSRALRMDKVTIAALNATLLHYLRGEALNEIPVWRMIAAPKPTIARRARAVVGALGPAARVVDGRSMVGGGSLPEESLPTALVSLAAGDAFDPVAAAAALRRNDPPIVARIEDDALLLDLRTVDPADDRVVIAALRSLL